MAQRSWTALRPSRIGQSPAHVWTADRVSAWDPGSGLWRSEAAFGGWLEVLVFTVRSLCVMLHSFILAGEAQLLAVLNVPRRLTSIVLVSVVVLAAGVLGGGQLSLAGQLSAGRAASGCAKVAFYGVRGSAERQDNKYPMGVVATDLAAALQADLAGTVKVVIVPDVYPAVSVLDAIDDGFTSGGVNYPASRADGIKDLGAALAHQAAVCPSTWTVLAGYSQGADVVATYLAAKVPAGVTSRIAGVALLGDPRFNPADEAVDAGSFSVKDKPLLGVFPVPPDWGHREGARPDISGALASKTISACNKGDLICNYTFSNGIGCVGVNAWQSFTDSILFHEVVPVPEIRASCAHLH